MATITPKYGQEEIWKGYMKRGLEKGFITQEEYDACIASGGMEDSLPQIIWDRIIQDPSSIPPPGLFIFRMIQLQFEPPLLSVSVPNVMEAYITKMNQG